VLGSEEDFVVTSDTMSEPVELVVTCLELVVTSVELLGVGLVTSVELLGVGLVT
jgi:hypothetical protein